MRAQHPVLKIAKLAGLALVTLLLVGLVVVPALFVGAFILRPLGIVLLAVGLIAIMISPRFRAWLGLEKTEPVIPAGVSLPDNVSIHPRHSWAAREGESLVRTGVDHLLQRALGPIDHLVLPQPGTRVEQGDPLFRMFRGDRNVVVSAPVSGTVVRTNPDLEDQKDLLALDPYGDGWVVELESPRFEDQRLYLHRHPGSWSFLAEELDRLLSMSRSHLPANALLNDGGDLVPDFYRQIDDRGWKKINQKLFGGR